MIRWFITVAVLLLIAFMTFVISLVPLTEINSFLMGVGTGMMIVTAIWSWMSK
jgi:hypothetical protein